MLPSDPASVTSSRNLHIGHESGFSPPSLLQLQDSLREDDEDVHEQHLQLVAEQLAESLQRSVIIDDAALRPVAVSPQLGRVDQTRVEAVLQRRTSDRLRRLLDEHQIFQAREPVFIPANDELETLPRLCLPLLERGQLLGFLWFIDEPALSTSDIERATAAAARAAHLLHRRAAREAEEFSIGRRLADAVLSGDGQGRRVAARRLTADGALAGSPPYALAVIRYAGQCAEMAGDGSPLPPDLGRAAGDLRRRAGPGDLLLATAAEDELVAVTTADRRDDLRQALSAVPGPPLAAGLCARAAQLDLLHADLGNARYAAEVAARVAGFGRYADWAALGSYAAFQYMVRDERAPDRICPGVSALLTEASGMYERTVRAYLDSGANVQRTAAQLHIHRTTLYWRLANAAQLLGLDLGDGEDRLKLHLALKLAVLTRPGGGRAGPPPDSG